MLMPRFPIESACACRVSTAGLLMLLCKTYPDLFISFVLLLMLDLFSHWFQMYSTLIAGSSTHKVNPLHATRGYRATFKNDVYLFVPLQKST